MTPPGAMTRGRLPLVTLMTRSAGKFAAKFAVTIQAVMDRQAGAQTGGRCGGRRIFISRPVSCRRQAAPSVFRGWGGGLHGAGQGRGRVNGGGDGVGEGM